MIDTAFIEQCKNINVPTTIVKAIIKTESLNKKFAINVNRNGKSFVTFIPNKEEQAIKFASAFINAGFSVDVGLMQLNSNNFKELNTTLQEAIKPCKNIELATTIFYNFYKQTNPNINKLERLKLSLSAYNTGSFTNGFKNGYVDKYVKYLKNYNIPILVKN